MPVKSDATRRWVELDVLLPGTLEQVWQAIATGPGLGAWFTTATVEERAGGTIRFQFGDDTFTTGSVTAWDPPHRFAYEERDWNGDAPPVATECTIISRSGDSCVLRLVHTLFTSKDDWDGELESFEGGWPGFFEILRLYLSRFAGQPAAPVRAMTVAAGPEPQSWARLANAFGLMGVNAGETCQAADGTPDFGGTVQSVHQDAKTREAMVLLDRPGPGVALVGTHRWQGQARVAVSMFLYGDRAAGVAADYEPRLRRWVEQQFPSSQEAGDAGQ